MQFSQISGLPHAIPAAAMSHSLNSMPSYSPGVWILRSAAGDVEEIEKKQSFGFGYEVLFTVGSQ